MMEKADIVDFASTGCSLRTFPNQKLFTISWNIENCLGMLGREVLEVEFKFPSDAFGTCRLRKCDTSLTFEITLKNAFFCKVAFCNNVKDVLFKKSGESFDSNKDILSSSQEFKESGESFDSNKDVRSSSQEFKENGESFDSNKDVRSSSQDLSENLFKVDVDLNTLQNLPNDLLLIVCTVATSGSQTVIYNSTHWSYLEDLVIIAKSQPASFLKEKVFLSIGDDVEIVNKAVVCENSSVIGDIFKKNKNHPNIIAIEGIELPVLKNVVAFLNSGVLRCDDFESVYAMYGAASKCGMKKLQDACSRLLQLKINAETFTKVLFLAEDLKDFRLKNEALSFFYDHAEDVLVTDHWCELMQNKVELGLQAIAFRMQEKGESNTQSSNLNQVKV